MKTGSSSILNAHTHTHSLKNPLIRWPQTN
jgi:hypothetical protein